MSLPDIYRALFGKDHIKDGDVISFSEHGRVGGVSTGQGFKFSTIIGEITGETARVTSGGLDVNLQDQHTDIIDLHVVRQLGTFSLANATAVNDQSFTASVGHEIQVGEMVFFKQDSHFYQAEVLSVNTNTIGVDTPFDYVFSSPNCTRNSFNLAVNGSSSPVFFQVSPINLASGTAWDIVGIHGVIEDNSAMDSGKFGGVTALTKGVVFRKKNGVYKNIFNTKTNGDIASHCYDLTYDDKAPSGVYGLRFRRKFGGQSENGVTIRLNTDDEDAFQVVIQDDLTGLTKFHVIVHGHVVI